MRIEGRMRADWQIEVKEARVRGRVNLSACSEGTHIIILDLQLSSESTPDFAQGEFVIGVSEPFDSHHLEYVSVIRGHDCNHSLRHSRLACSSGAIIIREFPFPARTICLTN